MPESHETSEIGVEDTQEPENPRVDVYAEEYFRTFSETFPEATPEQVKKFRILSVNFANKKITSEDAAQKKEAEIQKLATLDTLVTTVFNHGHFLKVLDGEIEATERMPEPRSYLLGLDLDDFNITNKTLGHPKADELLKELGKVLVAAVRDGDAVGRTGGDEFSIILRRANPEVATMVARRIQEASINELKKFSTENFTQTISIGFCLIPKGLPTERVREIADAALYTVKNSEKNQIALGSINPENNSLETTIIPSEPVVIATT